MKSQLSVEIPKRIQEYYQNQDALDMLDAQKNPPPHFNMEEVVNFQQTKISLAVCKYEYFEFMYELFKKTWIAAIESLPDVKKSNMKIEPFDPEYAFTVEEVWKNGFIGWYWTINENSKLWLDCSVYQKKEKYMCLLGFSLEQAGAYKDVRLENDYWEKTDAAKNIISKENKALQFNTEQQHIEIMEDNSIAKKALEQILVFVESERDKS